MKTYRVYLKGYVTVEAENEEEAIEKAYEQGVDEFYDETVTVLNTKKGD